MVKELYGFEEHWLLLRSGKRSGGLSIAFPCFGSAGGLVLSR